MLNYIKNLFRGKNRDTQTYQCMKLDDFVQETLVQIVSGVSKAQAECQSKRFGAIISPKDIHRDGDDSYINVGGNIVKHDSARRSVQYVDMDLAVTVTESATTSTGIGIGPSPSANISVFGANINAEGKFGKEKQKSNVQVSRVHFKVPICLPLQKPTGSISN